LKVTIDELSARSSPAIIEIALRAEQLCSFHKFWPLFVGQLNHEWPSAWTEFSTNQSVPPDRVIDVIDPASQRWPATSAEL
jgi:hypothetical protein